MFRNMGANLRKGEDRSNGYQGQTWIGVWFCVYGLCTKDTR